MLLLCAACDVTPQREEPVRAAQDMVEDRQREVSVIAAPIIRAIKQAAEVTTEPLPEPPRPPAEDRVHSDAVDLIVRYEVSSPAYYEKRLQGVICPGAASGPTWGIGYDGGHQTASTIRNDWSMHPAVDRLVTTAGKAGPAACAAARAQLRDVRTPLPMAQQVFDVTMMPTWHRATRRAYPGVEQLAGRPEGSLVSNTFNRGTSFAGSRAIEKRHIRDVCVPNRDVHCIAEQLRASCRIWRGTEVGNGLCSRRNAEADLALKGDT